jgi:hypothetical protein
VLYVGSQQQPELYVAQSSDISRDNNPRYIALSHCWGGHVSCKLLATNYEQMHRVVIFDNLPKSFQDAVSITRRLGIPYLWIDSLCILQDSPHDWAAESPTMGDVFANAHCVVSATSSSDSDGGCFRMRPAQDRLWDVMRSGSKRYYVSSTNPSIKTMFGTRIDTAPLTKRAWAFQERLLSRRLVHFCHDTVLFECNSLQASELHPAGRYYEKENYTIFRGRLVDWFDRNIVGPIVALAGVTELSRNRRASRGIRGALDVMQRLGSAHHHDWRERLEFIKRWYELVSAYTERDLTMPTDRLVALSGVAERVQNTAVLPYLAGLWGGTSAKELSLLWVVGKPAARQSLCHAPSWSWASVSGGVALLPRLSFAGVPARGDIISVAKVEHAVVSYKGEVVADARSFVDGGCIEIIGPAAAVELLGGSTRALRLADDRQSHDLTFFPDWTAEETAQPSGSQALSTAGSESIIDDGGLIALLVVRTQVSTDHPEAYGLVLKAKAGETFERVGVFWAQDTPFRDGEILYEKWARRRVSIV